MGHTAVTSEQAIGESKLCRSTFLNPSIHPQQEETETMRHGFQSDDTETYSHVSEKKNFTQTDLIINEKGRVMLLQSHHHHRHVQLTSTVPYCVFC